MSRKFAAALLLLVGFFVPAVSPAQANPAVNTSRGAVLVDGKPAPGLAVHGYDVVAYFTDGKPALGTSKYSVVHEDATYRFASQEHADAFKATPAKFVPGYGGYCAYGVALGAKFDGDPLLWTLVDGKLYLNLDRDIAAAFAKDKAGNIKKADANWPKLADK